MKRRSAIADAPPQALFDTDLPEGWCLASFAQCVDVLDGKRVPVNSRERENRKGDVPYYGATGQVGWIDDYLFNEELLLLGEDGAPFLDKAKPVAYLIDGKTWVNNHAHVLRALSNLTTNGFLKHFLNQFDFTEYVNGTTRLKLTQGAMNSIPVRLPPLAEQKRIVAKLEELLARVNAARDQLATVPAVLKRFRQSVLAAACSGRLSEEWRAEHPVPELSNHRISNARDNQELPEIPETWRWSKVEELIPKGGLFDGPFGSNLKTSDYTSHGVRVVRLENIGQLRFIEEKRTYISREKYATLTKHTVRAGDIIFASFISDEVRACVLPELQTDAIAKADCFCIRPNAGIDRDYLALQLVSQPTHDALIGDIHGATRPRINTTQLKAVLLRMCPLPEQQEIVRRVDRLFALANSIKNQVAVGSARAEKLTQAILAKAFRGELVPTEAELARQECRDYELAPVLLERIQGDRASQLSGNRKRRPCQRR